MEEKRASVLKRAMATDYILDDAVQYAISLVKDDSAIMNALSTSESAGGADKYRALGQWLPKHVALSRILNLHETHGKRILDLGCGPGWFSWLARILGHTPTGLDIPSRPVFYKKICQAMQVPVVEYAITPCTALPDSLQNYDVIVALMAAFYFEQQWEDVDVWRFFLQDLDTRLAPGGVILLEMNAKYGLLYDCKLYDLLTEFGYRMFERFCIKTTSSAFYDNIQIYTYGRNFFGHVWRRAEHAGYDSVVWPHIDLLSKSYPKAVDISVQLAMSKILRAEGESAVALLERAVQERPRRLGYHILLAQLLFSLGKQEKARNVIQKAHHIMPRAGLLAAWEQLLQVEDTVPVENISPYWRWACQLLEGSPVWQDMLKERKDLAAHKDPISWYLRYGVPLLPVTPGFTPLIYWGVNYDVLLSGQDPLLHYIAYGEREQRLI